MNLDAETVRRALSGRILAIHEPSLRAMVASLTLNAEARQIVEAPAARIRMLGKGSSGVVAVIPIHGVIEQRGGLFQMLFGGASCDQLTDQVRQAVNDPSVAAVVLDVDSPGGDVAGIDELAQEIYNARKQKPITAVSNCLCASAAYYLASQASELLASPSSLTGSVGVYTTHEDDSRYLDNAGVKFTLVHFGQNKTEGNSFEPLSDDARGHMQQMVDTFGNHFEKAVARGRGVKQADVHDKYGQGRVYDAKKAVSLGMVDRVGTIDDALAKHGAQKATGMRGSSVAWVEFSAGEEKDTKRVDGKDCPKRSFAYRPDDKKENWKLPIESPDDDAEWDKSHIRNAISRWSHTDMPDAKEKDQARSRIKAAAKKHGIEVSDDSLARGECTIDGRLLTREENQLKRGDVGDPDDDINDCACECAECEAGNCEGCSCKDCACDGCACGAAAKSRKRKAEQMRMQLELEAL